MKFPYTWRTLVFCVIVLTVVFARGDEGRHTSTAHAAPNYQINYQGKLTDDTGATVTDGTYNIAFNLYDAADAIVWSSTTTVPVTGGLFSYLLGSSTPLTAVNFNQTLYLSVNIGGTGAPTWDGEMTPRKVLGAVPAAFEAQQLAGLATTSFLRSDQADSASGYLTFLGGASTTDLSVSGTATTTDLIINGALYDNTTSAGLSGHVLQSTASGLEWVATSTLGLAASSTSHDPVSLAGTPNYISLSGQQLTLAQLDLQDDLNTFSSANLANRLTDETGSGNLVFSASPVFSGLVGVGTSTPGSDLTVYGDLFLEGASRYLNFGATTATGSLGYGLRDNAGTIEFKNVAGDWQGIGSGGSSITFGTDNQIPYTNGGGTDFEYSNEFTFDGSLFSLGGDLHPSTTLAYDLGSSTRRWGNLWAETLNIGTSTWSIFATTSGALTFTNAGEQAGTEALTILTSGNVGIGSSTPSAKLAIEDGNLVLFGQGAGIESKTVMMLHMDGSDGSTDFIDSSPSAHSIATSGDAQLDTSDKYFGSASGLFDGTGDIISMSDSTDFTFGSDDFTLDFWLKRAGGFGVEATIAGQSNTTVVSNSDASVWFRLTTANRVRGEAFVGGTYYYVQSTTAFGNGHAWAHIAFVRDGSTLRLFVNGTEEDTTSIGTGVVNDVNDIFAVGRAGNYTGAAYNGRVDEFRVTKGLARWTFNFTPPTSAYRDAGADSGHIGIGVAVPEFPIEHSSGALLSIGGAWTNASDRNLKENFAVIDTNDILTGINALDIERWNYTLEDDAITHIGPVAQDFYAQFGLGGSDTSISTIDASGVALVGVQALSEKYDTIAQLLGLDLIGASTSSSTLAIATSSTASSTLLTEFIPQHEDDTIWSRLYILAANFVDGVLRLASAEIDYVRSEKIESQELCLGTTCVSEGQLQALLAGVGSSTQLQAEEGSRSDPAENEATSEEDTTPAEVGKDDDEAEAATSSEPVEADSATSTVVADVESTASTTPAETEEPEAPAEAAEGVADQPPELTPANDNEPVVEVAAEEVVEMEADEAPDEPADESPPPNAEEVPLVEAA